VFDEPLLDDEVVLAFEAEGRLVELEGRSRCRSRRQQAPISIDKTTVRWTRTRETVAIVRVSHVWVVVAPDVRFRGTADDHRRSTCPSWRSARILGICYGIVVRSMGDRRDGRRVQGHASRRDSE
jgi:hypothetical protein